MRKRPLGSTGIEVSPIGFGTVKLGRDQGVKYPRGFTIPDDNQAADLIALAASLGINLIDTAPAYGRSEIRLGTLLKGQRDRWVICSKVGEEFDKGESRFDFTPEHTRYSVERSLKRLDTDYIDIVLVHSSGEDVEIIRRYGILQVLEDLKKEGLIRATGMSTKTVEGGLLTLQNSDCAMVTWNLAEQSEKPVIDYAAQHSKGILIKKALASGHVCSGGKGDPVADSMRFIFSQPGVSAAILGTINPDHMRHNVGCAEQALKALEQG
jgi:aryl-alcohol dehydrogenase-like predicted oxidoreductase